MRFDDNVVRFNHSKLVRKFEENAHLAALNEREKLTVFRSIRKSKAATWIEMVEAYCLCSPEKRIEVSFS